MELTAREERSLSRAMRWALDGWYLPCPFERTIFRNLLKKGLVKRNPDDVRGGYVVTAKGQSVIGEIDRR